MDITFINVGYGESILITAEEKEREDGQFVMLIDGGSAMDSEYQGKSGRIRAIDFLSKKGIRHIDLLVFSHVHEDHTSGLVPVIGKIPVRKFWTSVHLPPEHYGKCITPQHNLSETNFKALDSINNYSRLMKMLADRDVTWLDGIKPSYFCTGDLSIDVLGPEPGYREKVDESLDRVFTASSDEALNAAVTEVTETMNNASLVVRLHYKGCSVLLCGDTNADGFRHILDTAPELLKADVFKIGHHGQADSVSEELLHAVNPSFIVCCASNDHRSNSTSEKTFETIRRTLGEEKITCLFQDGLYAERWNPETAPRNGVTVHIDDGVLSWYLS